MSLGEMLLHPLLVPVWVPILAGLLVWCVPRQGAILTKIVAVAVALFAAVWGTLVWVAPETLTGGAEIAALAVPASPIFGGWAGRQVLAVDAMSGFAAAAAGILAFLMTFYAAGFASEDESPSRRLFSGILLSVGATFGTLYAENLMALAVFWGFLGIPFFLVLAMGREEAPAAAKKAFIIVGGTDSLLILGIALLWAMPGGRGGIHGAPVATDSTLAALTYICFLAAALAKAGAIPLHSWIPGAAASAPIPAVALLPAALDKILGIYLLARISLTVFTMSAFVSGLVMILGAVTVVAAVFMALVQHDLRKLLGFHAVSQVGYMVLGIGTGTFVGVAGGLFHMLNNAIYKSCLFLTSGSAERKAGTSDLGRLGALAKTLPVTFASACVAALAISGVPPLNGFFSKWMVYQGVVEAGTKGSTGYLWIVLLAAATFGSALTLASFVKVIYSVYLGPRPAEEREAGGPGENLLTIIPMALLALACLVLGVLASSLPVGKAIVPAVVASGLPEAELSVWWPGTATVLIIIGIVVGLTIYAVGTALKPREDSIFVGGEVRPELRFGGPEFYETVTRLPLLGTAYRRAAKGMYDFYEWCHALAAYAGQGLRALHAGYLYRYVTWLVLGVVLFLWVFLRD